MDRRPRRAAVALGSNVGDRASHLAHAVDRLRTVLSDVVVSTLIETVPDHDPDDPLFLNGALVGTTQETPERLLVTLLAIERERGRERDHTGAPRTLDLDLVLVGELRVESSTLRLPHPRFRSRPFVLGPLADIAPGLVDPVTGRSVGELCELLDVL
ncbi:MAG: 2-amino-4-hydroxy-6-hydroxymethyldihydropteridine diphosphokinase [Acidobacteria bacterium]|nr:2-amino-4-hydroxy-6-hydroxymethyldihydropteridine diphosphokinase [Acidobacteriota bacterium]